MATFSVNQVRDIIITTAEATESTAATFLSTASAGESRVLKADGSGVPTTVSDFYVVNKRSNGDFKSSDVIKANQVKFFRKQAPVTAVLKSIALAIPTGITVGTIVRVDITLDQWGSASFEDQYFKFGLYKVVTGDTVEDIADGLIASLARNFSREEPLTHGTDTINTYAVVETYTEVDDTTAQAAAVTDKASLTDGDVIRVTGDTIDNYYDVTDVTETLFADIFTLKAAYSSYTVQSNPLFTFGKTATTGGTYSLTITEKNQSYVLGKKQARHLVWSVTNDFDSTQTETVRVINPTSGQRIADLEWFCRGDFGDRYRDMGYPHNFDNVYDASASEATGYYTLELGFWYEGGNHAVQKSEKVLTIASTSMTEINKLITDIEAGTGLTLSDFS